MRVRKLEELDPHGAVAHLALAHFYRATGDTYRVRQEWEWCEKVETDPAARWIIRARLQFLAGERGKSLETLSAATTQVGYGKVAHLAALVYAEIGDLDACFGALQTALETLSIPMQVWQVDPTLAQVRADPRYEALLRTLRIP